MKIRKFQAASVREAIAQVRQELGADAMIVATRQIRRGLLGSGVEVTAAVDVDDPEPSPIPRSAPATQPPAAVAAPAPASLSEQDVERIMLPLRSELRSIRAALRPGAAGFSDDSREASLRAELRALRSTLAEMRAAPQRGSEPALSELVARHVLTVPSEKRCIALVGPTGVGKSTTIAKLAARASLVEKKSVAIVTLDTYRVGGEEQMRAYADLIGVPLTLVSDPARLAAAVDRLSDKQRVYIDTAGRSPRDHAAIAEIERALAGVGGLEVHLVLSASSQPALLDACVSRYRALGIDRLLFTKVDEADDLSELVRAPARLGRPIAWITNGQRVPEDLEEATPEVLLDLATRGFAPAEVAA